MGAQADYNPKLAGYARIARILFVRLIIAAMLAAIWLAVIIGINVAVLHLLQFLYGYTRISERLEAGSLLFTAAGQMAVAILVCLGAVADPSSRMARFLFLGNQARALALAGLMVALDDILVFFSCRVIMTL